ncbi:MAG: hypothetical protein ACC645_24010, partial [Pirellulales bacterium]
EQLGLAPDSTLVGLSLDTVGSLLVLRVDLRMEAGLQDSMPLDVDLAGLAALATGNPFPANFSNLIGVSSTGALNMELGGTLDLALGFELDTTPTPFLYTGSGGTKLSLSAGASGQDLDFTAQVGPFGIFVIDGSADLTGGIDVTLAGAGGPRLDFGALSAGDIAVDISGDASATLPLYFPDESSPIGGEGANELVFTISSLSDLLQDVPGAVAITTPDLSSLTSLTPLGMISNPDLLIDGLNTVLLTIQDALDSGMLGASLPLIGDALGPAAQIVESFRNDLLAPLSFNLSQGGGGLNPIDLVRDTLFDVFASEAQGAEKFLGTFGALGLLQDRASDGVGIEDVEVTGFGPTDSFGQFDFTIGQTFVWDQPVEFDLGLGAVGLDVDADVELLVDWSLDFGFGVDQNEGFYFVTAGADELSMSVDVSLASGSGLEGKLGFLVVDIEDSAANPTNLSLDFTTDLVDPSGQGQLTFSEMISPSTSFLDLVQPRVTGAAHVGLDVEVNLGGLGLDAAVLPAIGFDFVMDWNFLDADPAAGAASFGGVPDVALENIELDLGSFISDFAAPILDQIGQIIEPLDWLLDEQDGMLFKRLPVLSDLAGTTVTLKDLAELLDTEAQITPFLDAVLDVYNLVTLVTGAVADANGGNPDGENLLLPFGDLVLSGADGNGGRTGLVGDLRSMSDLTSVDVPTNIPDPDFDSIGGSGAAKSFTKSITRGEGSFGFPLFKPENIFKLLLGQPDVTLVTYDLPELAFTFD